MTQELTTKLNGVSGEVAGTIRIAMADSICTSMFPQILLNFQKQYPKVKIVIKTGLTSDMFTLLTHNEVDLVYTLDSKNYPTRLCYIKRVCS